MSKMGSTQQFHSLHDLIRTRATQSTTDEPANLTFYPLGNTTSPVKVAYSELYHRAKTLGEQLVNHSLLATGRPILIHLDDDHDTLLYFWAVILSGGVPVITSPRSLSNVDEYRARHLYHLALLFESPVCITRTDLLHQFECIGNTHDSTDAAIRLHTIECLDGITMHHGVRDIVDGAKTTPGHGHSEDLALLMLTSGSTGNAKAVCLTHRQILAAVHGKSLVRDLHLGTEGMRAGTFLNWIGLDHVASLIEIHIQALYLNADQVHVHAADVVSSPYTFLDLCSRHAVARTFAPNSFLAALVSSDSKSFQGQSSNLREQQELKGWDLSYLRLIASGGEANDVQTCNAVNEVLVQFGAKRDDNIIMPGFGMTETCAGAIYNSKFPGYDISSGYKFASVGKCMPGIEMRITRANDGSTSRAELAQPSEIGNLEVRGEVVFQGYYRDPVATADAFTPDGWFRTGDRAFIDNEGNLCLAGRLKDVVNVNGVKIPTTELQSAVDLALSASFKLRGLVERVVCFAARAQGAATEQVVAACMTTLWPIDGKDMAQIQDIVTGACVLVNASCSNPVVFGLSERSMALLPVSTLGKVSGAKMRTMFELGVFDDDLSFFKTTVGDWRKVHLLRPQEVDCFLDDEQRFLRSGVAEICNVEQVSVDLDVSFFHLGFTSMDVIRLKHRIDKGLDVQVAVIDIMKNPTVRSLAAIIKRRNEQKSHEYDPIVTLRSTGTKSPLWLVHPGVGEVLVFVALAKHMDTDDRPINALRARGFEPGQPKFASITDTVETYVAAIRRLQPSGPYCLAGYSYGAMLAFEVAKRLEDVKFLGSFNLPPHIKTRMRQLGWSMCLLHLAQFLGLLTEQIVEDETSSETYRSREHESALDRIVELSDKSRMAELGLTRDSLARWTDVAYGLQSMAADYEPSGAVDSIDVFHAEPLKVAASSREEWVTEHLGRWADFSRTTPRLHAVGGAHYTMLGTEHVGLFARKLQQALAARGV
ncbi:acetyl-CoA synthetase-like protein [Rhypophila decipiens]